VKSSENQDVQSTTIRS